MANKDKFKQMQQGGGLSFQDMVQQAATVAAIEKQAEQPAAENTGQNISVLNEQEKTNSLRVSQVETLHESTADTMRFMRLPNPQIPFNEYLLVSNYCNSFTNMTRQDFVEMAIIEKLHREGLMDDSDFIRRQSEIRNRPPRGHRKGTKSR